MVNVYEWLLSLAAAAPAVALLIATLAVVPAWISIHRNGLSNRQGRWWSETQWALDASFSSDTERQKAGLGIQNILAAERWLGVHELLILDAAVARPLEAAAKAAWQDSVGSEQTGLSGRHKESSSTLDDSDSSLQRFADPTLIAKANSFPIPAGGRLIIQTNELTLTRSGAGSAIIAPGLQQTDPATSQAQHDVQLAAAKLKVTLDGRLQRETPPWISKLAID